MAEIKRMFVTARARRRGHARALLAELERLAADDGRERVRLYTTDVLREARVLYSACGYRPVGVAAIDGRMDLWLEKRLLKPTA
jgi:GNAT superfamily N-acetyltransferase